MANPATDVRVEAGTFGLFAKSRHLDARLKTGAERAGYLSAQAHEFAGIRPVDRGNRAGATQSRLPGCANQAAFLMVAAAIIIAKEIFTFRTGRSFHFLTSRCLFDNFKDYQ
jgi:hypothetical protein